MRLCERFHVSPDELREMPFHDINDWLTILRYEAEVNKPSTTQR
jgi:hypothetical protein